MIKFLCATFFKEILYEIWELTKENIYSPRFIHSTASSSVSNFTLGMLENYVNIVRSAQKL